MPISFSQLGILDQVPSKVHLDMGGISVLECLRFIEKVYSTSLDQVIQEGEVLNRQLVVLINGVSIDKSEGLDTIVKDGDKVLLAGMVSGG